MTPTEAGVHRRHVLAAMAVFLAECISQGPGADSEETLPSTDTDLPAATDTTTPTATPTSTNTDTPTATDTDTPTDTPQSEPGGWSVRFAYDGNRQGSVSVTTAEGDSHQAFDAQGTKIVDIERQLGVEPRTVQDIVVMAQKRTNDDRTLHVAIRKDGDVVAGDSTDVPRGQVMVSYHV